MWMTAEEALRRLKSKPQSLYANVSRGRVRAKPDPADQRRSLYFAEDVDRLAARSRGRRPAHTVAAEAVSWGEPVLPTAISTVSHGRLIYRGVDAGVLAHTATLEETAALLWGVKSVVLDGGRAEAPPAFETLMVDLARRAAGAVTMVRASAAEVLAQTLASLAGAGEDAAHLRLARHWGRLEAAGALRQALVLLADHELNASTFAARVAASTGASPWAGALAGLSTLTGPRHGTASSEVAALAEDIGGSADAALALADWLGEGRQLPGFGHPLYPDGDMRAADILAGFEMPANFARLAEAAERVAGERPNVDFALAALIRRFALPRGAGLTVFALARMVGWQAHMAEQAARGGVIRPRARYIGAVL